MRAADRIEVASERSQSSAFSYKLSHPGPEPLYTQTLDDKDSFAKCPDQMHTELSKDVDIMRTKPTIGWT